MKTSKQSLGDPPEWNLRDLYAGPDSKKFKDDLARAELLASRFQKKYQNNLAKIVDPPGRNGGEAGKPGGGAALAKAVSEFESLSDLLGRIASFAFLHNCEDTQDAKRAKFLGDTQETLTNINLKLLFFTLELNRLNDTVLDKACQDSALAHYAPWLEDLRREKPHQLDDRLEELFHEKSITGRAAWNRLFNETMTALRFDIEGEVLSLEPALDKLTDPVAAKRKAAAEAIAKTLGENLRLFTQVTNTLAKDREISDRWRGFKDVADARHLNNRVEREVVDALEAAVTQAYPRLSHRYYALKAKWFGQKKLDYWDRNAPLPEATKNLYTWDEAQRIVLGAYDRFDAGMAGVAKTFFDKKWIHAPVRTGKYPGAFSHPTVPSAHPYVLLNYQGKPRDVMTLAHELGHGVHQVLAGPRGALMAPTPLTLAETASVFGEMLTFQAMLDQCTEPRERRIMIAAKVEDMINTVVRQIAFYTFERRLHTARRAGELTPDQICKIWLEVQAESLGPSIRLGPGYDVFWSYIPHFIHSPFYVYAYAFGDCLVNSLYAVYSEEPQGFQEKYFDMLKAGGSKHHSELLAPFGLDAADPQFWDRGLGVIAALLDELEDMDQ